ncbi:hypothetical protein [Flavobacterium pectinovorum]|uniref:hypothetical protein n=1 Tax=Flavobacterium pectinovorum TaxID=29533 RepID=UPI001FABFDFA|nr:hypothetical protein [Flavobacterium pectinovorum]MCI9846311.1 hypothetical protein [Flavobacterium pectinovorum]
MKNFKTAIFTTAFVLCCLTNVNAQDSKSVKEKTIKSNSASELKSKLETQTQAGVALDKRRLKTRHETAKNSIGNIR